MKTEKLEFTKIPTTLMRRTDLSPNEKLILGYVYTRSNLEGWELSVPDIVLNTGIPKQRVAPIINALVGTVLTFVKMRQGAAGRPYKIYSIDSKALNSHMELVPLGDYISPPVCLIKSACVTNIVRLCDGTRSNIEEERKEEVQEEENLVTPLDMTNLEVQPLEDVYKNKVVNDIKQAENNVIEANRKVVRNKIIKDLIDSAASQGTINYIPSEETVNTKVMLYFQHKH